MSDRSAPVVDEIGFLNTLRARCDEIQITHEAIDGIAGFPDGLAAAVLSRQKPLSVLMMWPLLQTLGLYMTLHGDPIALQKSQSSVRWRVKQASPKRRRRHKLPYVTMARRRNAPWLWGPERAREMAEKSNARQASRRHAKAQLSAKLRAAALKRWRKPKVTEITDPAECRVSRSCEPV